MSRTHPWFHALNACEEARGCGEFALADLARSLLNGPEAVVGWEGRVRGAWGDAAWSLVLATAVRATGTMEEILKLSTDIDTENLLDDSVSRIQSERCFLAGFAANRLERVDEAERFWSAVSGDDVVVPRVELERAVALMNSGKDAAALTVVRRLLDEGLLDTPSHLRALAVRGLAAGVLGLFSEAEAALSEEDGILKEVGSEALRVVWLRRKASFLVARGAYLEALSLIDEALLLPECAGATRALFLSLRVPALMFRNELAKAREALGHLETLMGSGVLPRNVLALAPLRCELALRTRQMDEFFREAQASLDVEATGKAGARLEGLQLLARGEAQMGRMDSAEHHLGLAISLARELGYEPILVDLLFHAAGFAFLRRDNLAVRNLLSEARDLARKLGLELKLACFDAIIARLRESVVHPTFRPFVRLLEKGTRAAEVIWCLSEYGFFEPRQRKVEITSEAQPVEVPETELWERWFVPGTLLWLVPEGVVVTEKRSRAVVWDLGDAHTLQAVLARFVRQGSISLDEVHAETSQVPYHPLRHGEKSRSLVTRLRKGLAGLGVEVHRESDTGRFCAQGELHLVRVE